ncbi:hypothetical protein ES332_D01G019700v1 [Gossypium tomentosum]|uniref:E2 ubiquitin-conjugating enzyme n=1 Tax=Gossypium tomentosum TaxID=34277 RepID=A0A5D2M428_GOSTO|nr:hypothetical protein ES332_D01G019700v1 [Gossypium tomentosum]TYH86113.1 hypothetical protein ES332_D01G019700v1 [Gossypium tomentosum]TYH86114.1 hypothetical protein ES332_D01G019700v1 [Gossypium tomentosum]
MDIKEIENPTMVSVGSEKTSMDSKGKNIICYDKKWEDQLEDASGSDHGDTVSLAGSEDNYEFDLSYNYDDGDYDDYTDDVSDDCDNHEFLYEDDYWIMQSHFDNVDLSPGVEASLNLLKDSSLIEDMQQQLKAVAASFNLLGIKNEAILDVNDGLKSASTSTVMVPRESGFEQKKGNEEHIMQNFRSFKHFDVVDVFSSHRYCNLTSSGQTYPKEYAKRIQEEWKILESGLPETIYVRVCEANMGLLRAVIMGPSGTPYHDGLFFFDCFFPPKYPNEPPMVYFYSGGLRLNPNLYSCGKVCLSLLGTWHGEETEMWVPGQSTMLQVLVSIQALILNAKPFFNEPGFEMSYVGAEGEKRSRKYNEDAFALSLKTMIYTLRRPPQHFEDFVAGHFRTRAHDIIMACEAYKEGAAIGSVLVKDCVPDPIKTENSSSERFKRTMTKMIDAMVKVFVENGSTYEQFLNSST